MNRLTFIKDSRPGSSIIFHQIGWGMYFHKSPQHNGDVVITKTNDDLTPYANGTDNLLFSCVIPAKVWVELLVSMSYIHEDISIATDFTKKQTAELRCNLIDFISCFHLGDKYVAKKPTRK